MDCFIESVIGFVKSKGKEACPQCICLSINEATKFEPLLVMKSLPWLMDRFLLKSLNGNLAKISTDNNKWNVSLSDTSKNDLEKQESHCGRYYVLQHNDQRYIEFWLGAVFNSNLYINNTKVLFSENPKILFDVSKEEYERLPQEVKEPEKWYIIEGWKSMVREIPVDENGSQFSEIIQGVVNILNKIIEAQNKINTLE